MKSSTYSENLEAERSKLVTFIEEKQTKLDGIHREKDETESKFRDVSGATQNRTAEHSKLHDKWCELGAKYDQVKGELGLAKVRLGEVERLLSAGKKVEAHRDAFLAAQTQLVDAEAKARCVAAVYKELGEELSKDEASLQAELTAHAGLQLDARLAGDNGSALPKSITDLNISISGKQATLAAAEARKQSCADDVQNLRKKIAKEKKSWEYARFALAELQQLAAIEEIMPVLTTLLASMRECGHSYSQTEIKITVGSKEIEAARAELRKELSPQV